MEQLGLQTNQNQHLHIENFIPPEHYNTALYLRFSRDDGQTCDSSSIESQRMLLEKYGRDNGYKVYDVYVDDGYTGLNFDRPGFRRMLRDIEDGKVNLVITKDQSRLGRDYIQTGYYTEIYFADRNVRYIAINDGADTAKPENADFMPFRNIINNMYSKDISRKTKSAKRQRALNGLFINSCAPYGYKKDPNNHNKLIIDGEAAETVREIFRLALEGKGQTVIARMITAKCVLIPSAYKTSQGLKGFSNRCHRPQTADYEYDWSYNTVLTILRNRVYCGDIVNRKSEVTNYKTGKTVAVPKDKRIIVENMHEPIIGRDDFERVQQLITVRYMPPKYREENIFRGLLFCAECGRRMSLSHQTIKTAHNTFQRKPVYRCRTSNRFPSECLHRNYIYYDSLYEQILLAVQRMSALVSAKGEAVKSAITLTAKDDNRDKLLSDKSKLEKRLNALAILIRKLYEDYVTEVLSERNYKEFLSGYQKEQAQLDEHLTAITAELGKTDDYAERFRKLQALAAEYADSTELTAEMLNQLIERIEIKHLERSNGINKQQINIIYRFINTTLN